MTPQLITWIIASVAVLLSGGALTVAIRADRRANRAEASSKAAAERELWTALIAAMQHAVTANVIYSDMSSILLNIRSTSMELVDGVDTENQTELGRWLHAEHKLFPLMLEATSRKLAENQNAEMEAIVDAHVMPATWASGTINNLRLARSKIGEPNMAKEFESLADQAEANLKEFFDVVITTPETVEATEKP